MGQQVPLFFAPANVLHGLAYHVVCESVWEGGVGVLRSDVVHKVRMAQASSLLLQGCELMQVIGVKGLFLL